MVVSSCHLDYYKTTQTFIGSYIKIYLWGCFILSFRLLQNNPDLYQLYKDLVVSEIITAEEFWSNRANGQVHM